MVALVVGLGAIGCIHTTWSRFAWSFGSTSSELRNQMELSMFSVKKVSAFFLLRRHWDGFNYRKIASNVCYGANAFSETYFCSASRIGGVAIQDLRQTS